MWPRFAWHRWYEPVIRAAAGPAHAPRLPDPDRYAQRFAHCDVLVVGAGPAGLAAALAAAATGARVILCDEQAEPGGSLLDQPAGTINERPAALWIDETLARLGAQPNVTLLRRTTAFGYFPHNMVGLVECITDHLADAGGGRAARAHLAGACPRGRAGHRCDRAAAGFPRQRSPGRDARFRGQVLPASLWCAGRFPDRRARRLRRGVCSGARSAPGGGPYRYRGRRPRCGDGRGRAGGAAAGLQIAERATVLATAGWRGVRSVTLGTVAADGAIGRGDTVTATPC